MEIDNKWIADYDKAANIIKITIKEILPNFELIEENLERKTNYYYLIYTNGKISLELGGERGAIILGLEIEGNDINLYNEDERVNELKTASENNFIIAIKLLKEYFEMNNLI